MLADEIWAAADVLCAPHLIVPVDEEALAGRHRPDGRAARRGVVRRRPRGFGRGNYVRWVLDEDDRVAAYGFFAPRCDRVRVMPFLDGVPCSIHGIVLPDGTAQARSRSRCCAT